MADWEEMNARQNGLCFVCGQPPKAKNVRGNRAILHTHHIHKPFEVKVLLCSDCNIYWENKWESAEKIASLVLECF